MAIKTNKSDVIANFVRYHGRQPQASDMATIDYLTTKAPAEVESLLAKNSPITNGLIWSEYQRQTETQESVDKKYADAAAKNPAIAALAQGGSSLDEIINGLSTGNISGLLDWEGKPFSVADQQAALAQGMEDTKLYYEALKSKETADAESALAKKQADYQDYLIQSGQSFEADKATSDKQAADTGVLFSGSRVQREKNLTRAYEQDQATARRNMAGDIGTTARDFQYKYGNENNNLNKYYNLGSNTFNANKARGGVGSGALSSVYNPSNYDFQGTRNVERTGDAATRSAGYLWNKGNKLLSTGYQNKY